MPVHVSKQVAVVPAARRAQPVPVTLGENDYVDELGVVYVDETGLAYLVGA